jgi:hypothetical protein
MKPGILSKRGFWLFAAVVVWFTIFSLTSCTGEYHLRKAQKKAPYLFDTTTVVKYDTVFKPKQIIDTLFYVQNNYDTVTIEKERVRLRYVSLPGDTVYMEAECKGDTCINRVEYKTKYQ